MVFAPRDGHVRRSGIAGAGRDELLRERRRATQVDWGLSKKLDARGRCRTACGTPCFAAPELLDRVLGDAEDYDGRAADLWAAGCAFLELATGAAPESSRGGSRRSREAINVDAGALPWDAEARGTTSATASAALAVVRVGHIRHLDAARAATPFSRTLLAADPRARRAAPLRLEAYLATAGAEPPWVPRAPAFPIPSRAPRLRGLLEEEPGIG